MKYICQNIDYGQDEVKTIEAFSPAHAAELYAEQTGRDDETLEIRVDNLFFRVHADVRTFYTAEEAK